MTAPVFRRRCPQLKKEEFIARLHEAPALQGRDGFWVVSRFEDVRQVLLDHERFSSRNMGGAGLPLLSDDPPRHSSCAAWSARRSRPARIEAMRPEIAAIASDAGRAIEAGREVDIVAALATPLPVTVIARDARVPGDDATSSAGRTRSRG